MDRFWLRLISEQGELEVLDIAAIICQPGDNDLDIQDHKGHGIPITMGVTRISIQIPGYVNTYTLISHNKAVDGTSIESHYAVKHVVDLFEEFVQSGHISKDVSFREDNVTINSNLHDYKLSSYLGEIVSVNHKTSRRVLVCYKAKRSLHRFVHNNCRFPVEISTDRSLLISFLAVAVAVIAPLMQVLVSNSGAPVVPHDYPASKPASTVQQHDIPRQAAPPVSIEPMKSVDTFNGKTEDSVRVDGAQQQRESRRRP